MNKKEQLKMDELIHANKLLQDEINKHMKVFGELLSENFLLAARI